MTNHDQLFKELLTTFFAEFIELFLPELAGHLEPGSIAFLDKELFTDLQAGESREADFVVRARFRGQDAFFLIHLEHQAQPQAAFGRRMFHYFAWLHQKHGLPVYPIALFSHESARPEPEEYVVKFPDREVMRFAYRVIQLRRLNWREFVKR